MRSIRSLALLTVLFLGLSPSALAQREPRPISASERAAVTMVMAYLDQGVDVWWDYLATNAPLRELGQQPALLEIAVRLGPTTNATWQMQTAGRRHADDVAIFSVTFPSGIEETVQLEMVQDDGWRVRRLRTLIDPAYDTTSVAGAFPAPVTEHPWPTVARAAVARAAVARATVARATVLLASAVLLLLGLSLALPSCRARSNRVVAATVLLSLPLTLWSCGLGQKDASTIDLAAEDEVKPLGPLLGLRDRLATTAVPDAEVMANAESADDHVREVVLLWLAQAQLYRGDLVGATASLAQVPEPSMLPLAALLRARLALLQTDEVESLAQYQRALEQGPEHDGLHLEVGEARLLMGFAEQAELRFELLARMGTRLAEIYYWLAKIATTNNNPTEGEELIRIGWSLRPFEREALFSDPLLASLAARPTLINIFELSSHDEPKVERRTSETPDVSPISLPASASASLVGDHLTISVQSSRIVLPGGGTLAPFGTPILDAATARAQIEEKVLGRADELAQEIAATGVTSLLRHETETLTNALFNRRRWHELDSVTKAINHNVGRVRPHLVKLRAYALQQLGRTLEARDLLVALARSDMANNRRDTTTLYQLADTLAENGEYELAVQLAKKAQRISPLRQSTSRMRIFEMGRELMGSHDQLATRHFDLIYPRATGKQYPNHVGLVLEAERERLSRWIKVPRDHRIEVQLFPLKSFTYAYSSSIAVLGIFDGRVRVPLADLRSLHPNLISILSHEVAHAMIAAATNDNAPRWLHEGLAQHVEMTASSINPFPDLNARGRVLSLPVIEAILSGFGEVQFVDLAYSQAAWLVHGIEARYGVEAIHRLLDAFKKEPDPDRAVQAAFGQTLVAFESGLVDWAINQAPAQRSTQVRRYDREFGDRLIKRNQNDNRRAMVKLDTPLARKVQQQRSEIRQEATQETLQEPMEEWHVNYARATVTFKNALGPVVAVFRGTRTPQYDLRICTTLRGATNAVLADNDALNPPDPKVQNQLRAAYDKVLDLARACQEQKLTEARRELAATEQALGRAAGLMRPYGLKP